MVVEARVGLAQAVNHADYSDHGALTALIQQAVASAGFSYCATRGAFADIVRPGAHILLKPNWVLHCNKSGRGMDCMVTHPAFITATIREVLRAQPGSIIIADAPIQDCQFYKLVDHAMIAAWQNLSSHCPITVRDLRKTTRTADTWDVSVQRDCKPATDYCLFDLGCTSMLEPVSSVPGQFRNTNYDPRLLTKTHHQGTHQYLLWNGAFTADVIINLPKLKTHRKAGMTGALKNLVGLNGDKDYLPHHRIGGSADGGDCYVGRKPLKRLAEYFLDRANQRIGMPGYLWWQKAALATLALCRVRYKERTIEGEWYGNDTTWRMVLDLNQIVLYGLVTGQLAERPVRRIFSLTDAIVAGDAFGPLAPEPLALGAVTFATSSAFADLAHTALMQFDWQKIALIREAFAARPGALVAQRAADLTVGCDGQVWTWEETARRFGRPFRPPRGWQGHVEWTDARTRMP